MEAGLGNKDRDAGAGRVVSDEGIGFHVLSLATFTEAGDEPFGEAGYDLLGVVDAVGPPGGKVRRKGPTAGRACIVLVKPRAEAGFVEDVEAGGPEGVVGGVNGFRADGAEVAGTAKTFSESSKVDGVVTAARGLGDEHSEFETTELVGGAHGIAARCRR